MKIEEIKSIVEKMKEKQILECEIQRGRVRIKIKRATQISTEKKEIERKKEETLIEFTSPMVGTFHIGEGQGIFLQEGQRIEEGQTLCFIEAMKVFNEIKSNVSGVIEKIFVHNGHPVQYGQPLFLIRVDVSKDSYSK